jgi:hypothetical protein
MPRSQRRCRRPAGKSREKKFVSKFRPFGCRALMNLNKYRRNKAETALRAVKMMKLCSASDLNTSYTIVCNLKVLVSATGQGITCSQLNLNEGFFPYRNEVLIKQLDEGGKAS